MTHIAQNGYARPVDYQQKLSAAIVEGVAKLGEHAAEEIDKIAAKLEGDAEARAAQIVELAKEGADKLRGFANAMRERHREEAENASKFCDTVKLLHERFEEVEQQLAIAPGKAAGELKPDDPVQPPPGSAVNQRPFPPGSSGSGA